MASREELKKQREEQRRQEYQRLREAISKRKSISVKAEEMGMPREKLFRKLVGCGRLTPGHAATEAWKQYEHCTQSGYGYSYDPEFFEGI